MTQLLRIALLLGPLVMWSHPLASQQPRLTGTVVNARTGEPLASAQISIVGSGIGVLTQVSGRYALTDLPSGTHTVVVQRIGFTTVTAPVVIPGPAATVVRDFGLSPEVLGLDEIVVTGTPGGSQRRAVGNVVARVNASEITEVAPVLSVEQLLGSRVPGLVAVTSSGTLGADASLIRLLGSSSATLAGNPLVYIDGVRINSDVQGARDSGVSRLNDINPLDIESIEVIKGPAAATLYGTEAANGVIQIITKRGVTGTPTFDVSTEWGAAWLADLDNTVPMNYGTSTETGEVLSIHLPTAEVERGLPFLQRGPLNRQSISVRGGTDLIRYYGSYARSDQEGVVDWNWDRSDSGRLSLGILAFDAIDVDVALSFTNRETRFPGGWWASMSRGSPLTAVDYGGTESPRRGWEVVPEAFRNASDSRSEVSRTGISVSLSADPTPWFTARMIAGTDRTDAITHNVTPRRDPDSPFGQNLGSRSVSNSDILFTSLDLSGTATFELTDSFRSATSGGLQYNKRRDWLYSASGEEFATPILTTVGSSARRTGDESYSENVGAGFYVQEQLDWKNRVFVTGALRMDDNSAFGTNFDAAIYPKFSATWVVHEEPFFGIPFVSGLRLRGAWGAAGRQPELFDAARIYEAVTGAQDQPSFTPSGFGNPDLGPERGEELEVGFDAGLLEDRINLQVTHFRRVTKDAIVARTLAPSIGFPGDQLLNIGQISGWGTEAVVDAQIVNREALRWNVVVGLGTMHNRIDDLGGIGRLPVGRSRQHIEGYPLASVHNIKIVSARFESGDRGRVTDIMCDGGTGPDGRQEGGTPVPCSEAPLLYQGPGEPTWNLNFSSTLSLPRDIQLYANVDARGGNIQHLDGIAARHTSWDNSLAAQLQDDPIFMAYRQVDRSRLATYDAGFARLREIGVRYSLPARLISAIGASGLSLNVSARNLPYLWRAQKNTTIGSELIPSPEVVISDGQFLGESHSSQPPSTMATFTLRATF